MPTEQEQANMEVIRRWNDEGWTKGNYELAKELIDPAMKVHGAGGQVFQPGPEGLTALIKSWRDAMPDGYMSIDQLLADGDLVVIRNTWRGTHTGEFNGIPPSGKKIEVESIGIDRVVNGKVVEGWGQLDMLGMMQQMGMVLKPAEE
jgi:predicted ester cyclase